MTINEAIALTNLAIGSGLAFAGLALLWQARRNLWGWPVSALIALGGVFLGTGLLVLHLTIWRVWELPGEAFDRSGLGTLLFRLAVAFVVGAFIQRIVRGHLLTDRDRRRVDAP